MGRGKTVLAKIENPTNQRITFSNRKRGLLKKARELSVLCDVEIGLIIFSATGNLYEFGSPKMEKIMTRYTHVRSSEQHFNKTQSLEVIQLEFEKLQKVMDGLEKTNKYMIGEEIDSLSLRELHHYEKQLEKGSRKIRSKKEKLWKQNLKSLMKETQMCGDKCVVDACINLKGRLCDDQPYEDQDERAQDHDPTKLIGLEASLRLSL